LGTHVSEVAFHTRAGVLQTQLDLPVSVLDVLYLYLSVVLHARHTVSLRRANWPAPQLVQSVFEVFVQADVRMLPAAHVAESHFEHGA